MAVIISECCWVLEGLGCGHLTAEEGHLLTCNLCRLACSEVTYSYERILSAPLVEETG